MRKFFGGRATDFPCRAYHSVCYGKGGSCLLTSLFLLANVVILMLRVSPSAGSFPRPLSAAEEADALRRMSEGDPAARQELIERNLRLVAHVVKKYYASHEDQDDLISIGTIGLIKAVSSFDGSKGARLATYAARCVENEILMYFRAIKKQQNEVSLSEPIDGGEGDSNALALLDVIRSDDTLLEDIELSDRRTLVHKYIHDVLDDRERAIIRLRYGLDDDCPLTQREVSRLLCISRSYVSRIEKKALEKLKKSFDD